MVRADGLKARWYHVGRPIIRPLIAIRVTTAAMATAPRHIVRVIRVATGASAWVPTFVCERALGVVLGDRAVTR